MTDVHRSSLFEYYRGCRCDGCRAAWAAQTRQLREERKARRVLIDGRLVAPVEEHGVMSTYVNWGCRCVRCGNCNTQYQREYRQGRRNAS